MHVIECELPPTSALVRGTGVQSLLANAVAAKRL